MHNRKEVIINAAIKLIGLNGKDATSIADVAKEAGISKSTVFFYFANKEELVQAVFDYCVNHSIKYMQQHDEENSTIVFKLVHRFDGMLSYIKECYDEALLVKQYTLLPDNALYSVDGQNPHFNLLYALIEEGIKKGEIRNQDCYVLTNGYYGFLLQNYMTILKKPEIVNEDFIQACHQFIESILL